MYYAIVGALATGMLVAAALVGNAMLGGRRRQQLVPVPVRESLDDIEHPHMLHN